MHEAPDSPQQQIKQHNIAWYLQGYALIGSDVGKARYRVQISSDSL